MIQSVVRAAAMVPTVWCMASVVVADAIGATLERVEFTSASQQLARERGETIKDIPGDRLQGYLAKADAEGKRPAVVALHGCGGPDRKRMQNVADALVSCGYVALFVDSFSTRAIYHTCTPELYAAQKVTVAKRPLDALAGLRFLAGQSFVDSRRVAVIGFSQGAETALTIAEARTLQALANPANLAFRAAMAFYPPCRRAGARPGLPTLISIGALDDWTPAEDCNRLVAGWGNVGVPVELVVYPGAYHAFDAPVFAPGRNMFGHWIEYNPEAAEAAYRRMQEFLARHLGR